MLAYAANRPAIAQRRSSPNTMLAIIAAHVAVVALVMSAKMDLPKALHPTRTIVDLIRELPPPEPVRDIRPQVPQPAPRSAIDQPIPVVPAPGGDQLVDSRPLLPNPGPVVDPSPGPIVEPLPVPGPVKLDARLLTPLSELKPPYPESKLASGEEALLRLRLTVDEHGRVVAVEPIGRADAVFLDAARRYLMAHWRYRPASEDGRAITSSTVITLRFQLDS